MDRSIICQICMAPAHSTQDAPTFATRQATTIDYRPLFFSAELAALIHSLSFSLYI